MEQFMKYFRRESGGIWVCVEPATLDIPQGRIQVAPEYSRRNTKLD